VLVFCLENKTLKIFKFQYIACFSCILVDFYETFEEFLNIITSGLESTNLTLKKYA
jgi:hypothetical protein